MVEETVERVVRENYPCEVIEDDDVLHLVQTWKRSGVEGVAQEWFVEAGEVLMSDDLTYNEATEMMRTGLQVAGEVDDELAEKIETRVAELGEQRGD